jgi:apolipoprotein N-acyltransferase
MIFCLLYGFFRLNYIKTTTNKTWQIRLVQANIPQSTKWEETDKLKNLNHHIQLSQNNSHLDAIIWPETAIPFAVSNLNTHQLQQSLQSAIPKNGSLISGLEYGKVVNHIPLQETKFLDVEVHESQLNSLYTKLLL